MLNLRVVTLNLWNNDFFRFERAHLVTKEIASLQPHLVALQEVSIVHDMAAWIVNRLNEESYGGEYSASPWNKIGPQGASEGLAILSCLPVIGMREAIDLKGGGRIAQRIIVEFQGQKIALCNLHLHHPREADELRVSQSHLASEWMLSLNDCAQIMAGDFNSTPESKTMVSLYERWASAYASHSGKEPEYTSPTPLAECGEEPFSHRSAIDYILFTPSSLRVTHAELCFTKPGGHGGDLYPSDHYGLVADFEIK
ncbi:endonuclease/exonuclease/phosphatase [Candidatus Vecturithrix granuli]|uniref:Endonuclease/exonuclease/phosphatase n=1 Tax=Vecturithrix granuli TaxID=1499967 RepID=A0A0S6WB46_VECG1|nr:endonuclease/exonuclease/phosphatase [Candidatus Vecturithrix granuli]